MVVKSCFNFVFSHSSIGLGFTLLSKFKSTGTGFEFANY